MSTPMAMLVDVDTAPGVDNWNTGMPSGEETVDFDVVADFTDMGFVVA